MEGMAINYEGGLARDVGNCSLEMEGDDKRLAEKKRKGNILTFFTSWLGWVLCPGLVRQEGRPSSIYCTRTCVYSLCTFRREPAFRPEGSANAREEERGATIEVKGGPRPSI